MRNTLFEYQDYKRYLTDLADARPRGFRKDLAEAMGCHTAYVSQTLNGAGHLSLEQAERAARFLELSAAEFQFFLLLVEFQRAGTPQLKKYFSDQLNEAREKNLSIQKRIANAEVLSSENQEVYYSSWHYAAVHMAVTIPRLQTRNAILQSLNIESKKLTQILAFLSSVGLIKKELDRYIPGTTLLHLPKDSALNYQHQSNWKNLALQQMHSDHASENLNYSSAITLSKADATKVREILTQAASDAAEVIKKSPEEVLFGINIDLFRLDK